MSNTAGPKFKISVEDAIRKKLEMPKTIPEGFKTQQEFLDFVIKLFDDDVDYDAENRLQALEDAKFVVGQQWDPTDKAARNELRKPTLTINRIPAFVGQLVGNRKLNQVDIKLVPDHKNDKPIADIREGLIRSIQKNSSADYAIDKAFENQVISGQGAFQVDLEYAHDDVFDQDIRINPIPNALGVVWDRRSSEPTGRDADHVFVVDSISKDEFERRYPGASGAASASTRSFLTGQGNEGSWIANDEYRVVEYWRMLTERRVVALLFKPGSQEDQEVVDITDLDLEGIDERLVLDSQGIPVIREVDRKFAERWLLTATDILEGPYKLPIDRVPVFRVQGWSINVGDNEVRFGLVRFLKDPQRLLNYWRSVIAEKLMQTPRTNWIAASQAVEGFEDQWRKSHLSADPLLLYNAEAGPKPERAPPSQMEPALINQAGVAAQDLFDVSNIHQASLGAPSNEVSGRAILARQRVGDTGVAIYEANLVKSIEESGRVINQLIPVAYDTMRTVLILKDDGKPATTVVINDLTSPDSIDITSGKYRISSITGPSYVSKREEARESMLSMVNAAPQTMAIALDKIIEAQDWPGAPEIARRMRTQLPPGAVSPEDLSPEELQQLQQQQQAAQEQQQFERRKQLVELAEKEARADQARALAQQALANAAKAYSEVGIEAGKLAEKADDDETKRILEVVAMHQDQSRT